MDINLYELASVRERLMEKYFKGVITREEIQMLNLIEDGVDKIIKQRLKERIRS